MIQEYDNVVYWLASSVSNRGQGKRIGGGMVRGAMSARVNINSRYDVSFAEFKNVIVKWHANTNNTAPKNIDVNIKNIIFNLQKEDVFIFLRAPEKYILNIVHSRLE